MIDISGNSTKYVNYIDAVYGDEVPVEEYPDEEEEDRSDISDAEAEDICDEYFNPMKEIIIQAYQAGYHDGYEAAKEDE